MGAQKPNPAAIAKDAGGGTIDQGGTSKAPLYGLPAAAQDFKFSVDGIPGMSGQMSGKDILNLFLAAGQSNDQQLQSMAAAIQQALAYGGYYTSGTPVLGHVTGTDASALGRSLLDLYQRNQAQGGATNSGKVAGMGVAQFLGAQAAVGAAYGPSGAAAAVAPTVVNLRAPNAADVADTYMKVAQQITGKKPDQAQVAAFVDNYTQSFVANERQNALAQYDATVQKATVKATQKQQLQYAPTPPVASPPQSNFIQSEIDSINNPGGQAASTPQGQFLQGEIRDQNAPAAGGSAAPSLTDELQTIQDVINANTKQQGAATDPGLIFAGTQASENPNVAAENYARNQNPHAADATDINNQFGSFLQLLAGHIGG